MPNHNRFSFAYIFIGFLGFLDASYLAIEHYRGLVPTCGFIQGCDVVTTSSFSVLYGVPLAYLGVVYYLTVLLLGVASFDFKDERLFWLLTALSVIGFGASLGFVYLQLFVLKAICIYCMGSAVTSTALFITSLTWYWSQRVQNS
ncbi:MAG: vitamin K epoxide reductase family protein [Patescibacteria group bacterium]